MSNYLEMTKTMQEYLREKFTEVASEVHQIDYEGTIHVFFLRFTDVDTLNSKWQPIANAIAFHYQSKIASEFERWNFYIFYLVDTDVERGLKFKIENDPISSRKIVIELFKGELSKEKMTAIIDEHITNRNLQFTLGQPAVHTSPKAFNKNKLLAQAINYVPRTNKKRGAEDDSLKIIKNIETYLTDEIQKS